MTTVEKKITASLQRCSFLPGSFDKRFVNQLDNWTDREMTAKGRETLFKLYVKYRRQIKDFDANIFCKEIN
jgi:hypothetical protein